MRAVLFTLAVALLPVSAMGQGNDLRLAVIDQIRAMGCSLDQVASVALPDRLGVTMDDLTPVALDLVLDGLLSLGLDGAREIALPAALCDPAGTDLGAALIAQFRLHGCALTGDQGEQIFPALGLTRDIVQPAARALADAGGLLFDDATDLVRLSDAHCIGAGGPLPAPRGQTIALLAGSGDCRLAGQDAVAVMQLATGLPDDASLGLAERMSERGELYQDGDTVVLAPSLCALDLPAPSPVAAPAVVDVRAAVIAALNANGCAMTEDDGPALLQAQGVTMDDSGPVVEAMIAAGEATFDNELLTLSPALCTATAADTTPAAPMTPVDPMQRMLLLTHMRVNGCALPAQSRDAGMPAMEHVMTPGVIDNIVAQLLADGEATVVGGLVTLSRELCDPADALATQAPNDPRASLIAALIANGCAMTEGEADTILPRFGLTIDDTQDLVAAMIDAGEATFADDLLTLSPALCVQP